MLNFPRFHTEPVEGQNVHRQTHERVKFSAIMKHDKVIKLSIHGKRNSHYLRR